MIYAEIFIKMQKIKGLNAEEKSYVEDLLIADAIANVDFEEAYLLLSKKINWLQNFSKDDQKKVNKIKFWYDYPYQIQMGDLFEKMGKFQEAKKQLQILRDALKKVDFKIECYLSAFDEEMIATPELIKQEIEKLNKKIEKLKLGHEK